MARSGAGASCRCGSASPPRPAPAPWRPGPEEPVSGLVAGQVVIRDLVLGVADLAVHDRNALGLASCPHASGEAAGHPHQVSIVELVIAAVEGPPPGPEAARGVAHPEVGVDHDPVHAVGRRRSRDPNSVPRIHPPRRQPAPEPAHLQAALRRQPSEGRRTAPRSRPDGACGRPRNGATKFGRSPRNFSPETPSYMVVTRRPRP